MTTDATMPQRYDIAVIGGGINGTGIAADAAGRGLTVVLAEQADLASGTSSASSKLIHGGLRYLEHYEFRLVREGLAEREVLMARAPHLIRPQRFVLPHVEGQRPRWMIRAGLFLYDHLYRRRAIPGSRAIDLTRDAGGRPLAPHLTRGFIYWDCWVDDARLVVLNARAAADRGARIATRTRVVTVTRQDGHWLLDLEADGRRERVAARVLVNAAGPWVDRVTRLVADGSPATAGASSPGLPGSNRAPRARLVKGSHIVVPRIAGADDAYLMQSPDGRIVFVLPFEQRFSIIGTTDIPFDGDPADVAASAAEEHYLVDLASRFFRAPITVGDIVWRYCGVRSLYDDGRENPSAVTRDYRLELDAPAGGTAAPSLTVYGGKVTTHRRLAEDALDLVRPHLPTMGPAWTRDAPLPGGAFAGPVEAYGRDLAARHPTLAPDLVAALVRRHGTNAARILESVRTTADLGPSFGPDLTAREVAWMGAHEWARTADDVLWRRSKAGLHLSAGDLAVARAQIDALLATQVSSRSP